MIHCLPLSVRAFLMAFVPICITLAVSLYIFRVRMEENVKSGLRATLVETQREIGRVRTQ
jgi:hypothetical protein